MNKVKVLVVDDSAFMRKLISDFLSEHPRLHVVGTARDGQEALQKIEQLNPDVVTLDVEMPVMNGLETLKHIMQKKPLPVVMISSTTTEGAENTILALQYGAVDFIAKPSGTISLDLYKIRDKMIEKVLLASEANLRTVKIKQKMSMLPQKQYSKIGVSERNNAIGKKKIIAIGTSTGGPRALQHVLTKFPATIDAPILIVQHMPKGFTKSLATRLDSLCNIRVKEAEDGEVIQKGIAYIAPGGNHLYVKRVGTSLAIHLDEAAPRNGHRPSVDVMFESLSALTDYEKVAVIMTGMGSDGTAGLKQLKASGNTFVVAESAESSVVFGMPKSAIAANVVDEIVHVDDIAEAVMRHVQV
ncbi:chemotaxis response regulator protein-glutamate methylesterase [Anoxybacillus sp. FSL W8-0382]|uniref:Protein-glutamate methylesterase/protein-glutamine glutaminase n=1 Tax=Anoxybacillus flavithermus TaxID=33934 RepID=A0A178TNE3_9BACL|nr:chemotaxis response regulator protein-glutamate methylesterase [Anoxybacillus flavithermus]ASA96185.1 chemotaxis response regulator protein-glutamate methylesterase [Anoxybacillus flavithermus]MBE2904071.1 chemotaxis response regulator protein-glutamate methylesterase [Anoxybacillus flavithermus]MBE2912327.1 chemotaxis response regulator protein-glutamate methylesterase [Anoxybacillus flavithermus]MBE2939531.1 chemotaxis response regulator protein-glutamate methylesterase [Anoxybacillus flav